MSGRRPSEPKYCAMKSVIISPKQSRASSVRLSNPRMRAETLTVPNTWIGSEPAPSSQRVRKISHPSYMFFGEDRAYDFPAKSNSSQLYADDDYRSVAGQFLDSNCPGVPTCSAHSPPSESSREENSLSQNRNSTTRAYHQLLLFVAATLLIVLLVTGLYIFLLLIFSN